LSIDILKVVTLYPFCTPHTQQKWNEVVTIIFCCAICHIGVLGRISALVICGLWLQTYILDSH